MNSIRFPTGYVLERLIKAHPRKEFTSGQADVDDWLRTQALQSQKKNLSTTKALLYVTGTIAGFYTLATAQIDFQDLPSDVAQSLPRRKLPVAVLAWLGVDTRYQGQGLGKRLLAQALQDCYQASQVFPFIAVVLDCIDDKARAFYQTFQFASLPGHPYKCYLSFTQLEAMMKAG